MAIQVNSKPKDTVTVTVELLKPNRQKLREMKGILRYPTLDKTINTAVDMVDMRSIFTIAMEDYGFDIPIEAPDIPKEVEVQIPDDPLLIPTSLTTEEQDRLAYCNILLDHFSETTIDGFVKSDKVPLRNGDNTFDKPCTEDERAVIDILKDRLVDLKVKDLAELVLYMEADIIKIRNTTKPQISPAGEMIDDN